MTWTVLTGDIVDSSNATQAWLDHAIGTLQTASSSIATWATPSGGATTSLFARRAGDGWQIAMDQPALALRAALYLQSQLKGNSEARTRIAVATGDGTLPSGPDPDLNSAHGPAFIASGRLLENLSGQTLMAHASGGALDAAFRLADHIAQGWTQAQARAVAAMLPPGSGPRRVAAETLGISRQAIDQALHAAGFPAIDAALDEIEAAV